MAKKGSEDWIELARVIPWQDEDFSPARLMPEIYRDEEGQPRGDVEPPPLTPHIVLQDAADPEKGTKVVEIPDKTYKRIRAMLDSGELAPEDLSHLPLADLVPELVKELGTEGRARSGVARGLAAVEEAEGEEEEEE